MAEKRKLLAEIEKCFKKIDEGVELFEETMDKINEANSDNQREKLQDDLKKEIKKLQRLRDQVKNWQNSSEIKDKDKLTNYRKLIESKMEAFKDVERENKTKPHSKQGLCAEDKLDPREKAKMDLCEWIQNTLRSLNDESDKFEATLEQLTSVDQGRRRGKGKDDPKKAEKEKEIRDVLDGVKLHIDRLELTMRLVNNDTLDVRVVEETLKDELDQLIEQLVSDSTLYDCEGAYEDLDLDQYVGTFGKHTTSMDEERNENGESHSNGGGTHASSPASIDHPSRHASNDVPLSPGLVKRVGSISTPSKTLLHEVSSSSVGGASSAAAHADAPVTPPPPPPPVIPYNSIAAGRPPPTAASAASAASSTTTTAPVTPAPAPSSLSQGGKEVVGVQPSPSTAPLNSSTASSTSTSSSSSTVHPPPPSLTPVSTQSSSTLPSIDGLTIAGGGGGGGVGGGNDENRAPPSHVAYHNNVAAAVSAAAAPHPSAAPSATPSIPLPAQEVEEGAEGVDPSTLPSTALPPSTAAAASEERHTGAPSSSENGGGEKAALATVDSRKKEEEEQLTRERRSDAAEDKEETIIRRHKEGREESPSKVTEETNSLSDVAMSEDLRTVLRMSQQPVSCEPQTAIIHCYMGASPLGSVPETEEYNKNLTALDVAFNRLPQQMDSEKPRSYLPKMLCVTPTYYPQQAPSNADTMEYYLRLTPETLFFTFYYMEGSRAQLLAAKALKKLSWRFHTKYLMWFQRHEEPKQITDDYEEGTYVYFDYEKWSQRKKEQFRFEYRYLEDRDFD